MVDNYVDTLIENAKKRSKEKFDENALREYYRTDAIWSIKWGMVKDKIAELENIKIEDEDFEAYFKETAESDKIDEENSENSLKLKI